ncbi:hypothetical protein BDW75DRAFT_165122 [Aspergillus navahoensis]
MGPKVDLGLQFFNPASTIPQPWACSCRAVMPSEAPIDQNISHRHSTRPNNRCLPRRSALPQAGCRGLDTCCFRENKFATLSFNGGSCRNLKCYSLLWRINLSLMISNAASFCCLLDAPRLWRLIENFRATSTDCESLHY